MSCDWGCCGCEPEPDVAEKLIRAACEAGVHGTRTLGPCLHSPKPTTSPIFAFILTEALAQLRLSLAATRMITRTYDSRKDPDFGPLGSAWTKDNDLGRPA